MARTPTRWILLTAAGVAMAAVCGGAMAASMHWIIVHRAGASYVCLHYGAIGRGVNSSAPATRSPWSIDAWSAVRSDAGLVIWAPETTVFSSGQTRWWPLWPGVAAGLSLAAFSLLRSRLWHWSRCRGCGYKRVGLTYDLPCPECGVVPRPWRP